MKRIFFAIWLGAISVGLAAERPLGQLPDGQYYIKDEVEFCLKAAAARILSPTGAARKKVEISQLMLLHPAITSVSGNHLSAENWLKGEALPARLQQVGDEVPAITRSLTANLTADADAATVVEELRKHPDVEWASLNLLHPVNHVPNDTFWTTQWGPARIKATDAWDVPQTSTTVRIAIIDTGVDLTHPDLASRIAYNKGFGGNANGNAKRDRRGGSSIDHGTHVAGIAAAIRDNNLGIAGVAHASIMAMGCAVWNASANAYYIGSAPTALNDAIANGADMVNCSFGQQAPLSAAMRSALDNAQNAGVIVVCAAGNDSMNIANSGSAAWAQHGWPIIVSSIQQSDALSGFSNFGNRINLCAPGSSIYSTMTTNYTAPSPGGGAYASMSGTSMAAPHVAGAAAAILRVKPTLSALQVVSILTGTAEDLGPTGRDNSFGWGVVRVDRAINSVIFTYTTNASAITITGYTGAGGAVIIPATITGYPVVRIGSQAFANKSTLVSVTIPNSVTNIGVSAFSACSGLTNVVMGNSVTSIGDYAFSGCNGLTNVVIGNSMANIGAWAFNNCSSLKSATIPNSVTSIGEAAFSGCNGLTNVVIGNSVANIGAWAFNNCSSLKSVTIPNSVTSIGEAAFASGTGLTNIIVAAGNAVYSSLNGVLFNKAQTTLISFPGGLAGSYTVPNSVTSIGDHAFVSCYRLTNVTISNSVTSIGYEAFYGCAGLTSITIPNSVTSLGDYAFSGCSGLTNVVIGNSVTSIGDGAFSSCSGLANVVIGNSVTNIGNSAFQQCFTLTSVTIPNSVTSIGDQAFSSCINLTTIIFLGNAPVFGSSVFYNVAPGAKVYYHPGTTGWGTTYGGLATIMVGAPTYTLVYTTNSGAITITGYTGTPDSILIPATINGYPVTRIGNDAFLYSGLTSVVIPNSVTSIGVNAFSGCDKLRNVAIGGTVRSIGDWAFYNCNLLTSVVIPNSVTSIGNSAFQQCFALTSVLIGNSVTSLGEYAFNSCSALTSVVIGNSVESIRYGAFWYCPRLTSVVIPDSVTSIGGRAFYNCSDLTSVLIGNGVTNIGNEAFYNCYRLTSAVIPNSVTSIGYSAFQQCYALTSVTIPTSVTSISDGAFYSCSSLTNVVIGNSVTSIGSGAFFGCASLTSVVIPNSVTSIGSGAFAYCSGLTNVTFLGNAPGANGAFYGVGDGATVYYYFGTTGWGATYDYLPTVMVGNVLTWTTNNGAITITGYVGPSGGVTNVVIPAILNGYPVTSIGSGAFYDCSGLTNVVIPNSVTSIGYGAFYGCERLTSVIIPNSVRSLGASAFSVCSGLMKVVIGNSVTNIGDYAFEGCASLTSVVIPNSATSLGGYAFESCSSLTNVLIGNSVTRIGDRAFNNCNSLTDVVIGNSVTNIGYGAFWECSALPSVVIPNSVTSLGGRAFANCFVLTSAVIPNSVTSLGDFAFVNCSGLTSVVIPDSVTSIGNGAFSGCTSLTNITVAAANSAYSSTDGVLFNSTQTILIAFPAGIHGSYAVPNSVTSIESNAFYNCSGLTSVVIPNSVTSIGNNAFFYCASLTNLTFLGNTPALGASAFANVAAAATVYYYNGTGGWGATYGGLPTVMLYWRPQIGGDDGNVGVEFGTFGFTISGLPNQTVTVEASTNLVDWEAVQVITLSGPNASFSDPQWTNYPSRFYRVRTGGLPPLLTVPNLSGASDSRTNFMVAVLAGKPFLQFSISGGSGDCDLYVRFGAPPTLLVWDYAPYLSGNNETVTVSNPTAGNWYIMLHGYESYSGVTLQAQ